MYVRSGWKPYIRLLKSTGLTATFAWPLLLSNGTLVARDLHSKAKEVVIAKDFGDLFDSHELADLKLFCGSDRFPITAHRVVLAARSRFFMQIIKTAMRRIEEVQQSLPLDLELPNFGSSLNCASSPHIIGDTPFQAGEDLVEISPGSSPGNVPRQQGKEDAIGGADENLVDVPLLTPRPHHGLPKIVFGGRSPVGSTQRTLEVNEAITIDGTLVSSYRLVNGILELELPELSHQSLSPIIKFLYSTRMDLTSRNLVGVFSLSHDMGLSSLEPDILAAAPTLYSEDTIVDLLIEAESANYGKKLLDSMFFWLNSDSSRSRAITNSCRLSEIPLTIMTQMLSSNMFPDEFELYEKLAQTVGGGEVVDQLLSKLNFLRMTSEQLARLHNTGKVKDSIILEAFKLKATIPEASRPTSCGTVIVYDMTLYGDTQVSGGTTYGSHFAHKPAEKPTTYHFSTATLRGSVRNSRPTIQRTDDFIPPGLTSSRSSEAVTGYEHSNFVGRPVDLAPSSTPTFGSPSFPYNRTPLLSPTLHIPVQSSPGTHGPNSSHDPMAHSYSSSNTPQTPGAGISPLSLKRRRSVAVASPAEADAAGLDLPTDTWLSDPFQVHAGNWSIALKTRGGMIYKVGLVLNHTTNEWDAIRLESWALIIETLTSPSHAVPFNFGETLFSTGKEWFKIVKGKTSAALGMPAIHASFKKPHRIVLRVKVLFPVPEQISLVFEE